MRCANHPRAARAGEAPAGRGDRRMRARFQPQLLPPSRPGEMLHRSARARDRARQAAVPAFTRCASAVRRDSRAPQGEKRSCALLDRRQGGAARLPRPRPLHRYHRLPARPPLAAGRQAVLSYRDLAARVSGISFSLKSRFKLAQGERVALAMKNCPQYYEVLFVCWHAGLAAVPMNAKLHAREFAYILENAGARLCVVSPELQAAIPCGMLASELESDEEAVPAEVRPEDAAWLFYTSGTTGVPKGAVLTHRNLWAQTLAYFADIDKLGPRDAVLHAAPLSHGSGLYGLPHFAAGAVNVIPESGHFEPQEIFDLLDHWQNTSFFAAPTMIVRLLSSAGE